MKNKRWLTVLISGLMIFTLGCSSFTRLLKRGQALSTTPPIIPAPPGAASLKNGTPEEQAGYFANLLASPNTRLAGWLGIYDALGIPVIGQDGAAIGSTGADPIGPRFWRVWYASGLDKMGRGIPLRDAGRLIAGGSAELAGDTFGATLLKDLRLAIKSNDPQVRLMAMFVRERIKRWPSHLDIQDVSVTPEKAIIDLPTLQMIVWIVTRGAIFQAAAMSGERSGANQQPTVFRMAMFQTSNGGPSTRPPCSEMAGNADATYWTNWVINKALGGGVQLPGMSKAFTSLIEKWQKVGEVSTKVIDKTASTITKLNASSALLSFLLQLAAMEIEPRQTPAPLIRTHDTYRGKDGAIELQLYSAPDKIPNGNELKACLGSFAANAMGISFSMPADGPISGAEMTIEAGAGFPDLVLFNSEGTNTMRRSTGKDGVAEYKLFGAPQKHNIPDDAKPVNKEFSVYVKAQPEEAGLNSMLNIFFGGLTFGAAPSAAGGFGSAIDIAKGFQYDMGEYVFNLTDWGQQGYRAAGHDGPTSYSGVICSLEKPFDITATNSFLLYPLKFVPASATAGTLSYNTTYKVLTMTGSGTYTIEGAGTDRPRIRAQTESTLSGMGRRSSGGGPAHIDLVPLDTDECNGTQTNSSAGVSSGVKKTLATQ
jgi:hypothetical protein